MAEDESEKKALFRFQVISPLLALELPRGQKRELYKTLAAKEWSVENGETVKLSEETIRRWLRIYRRDGFEGLKDRPRPLQGGKTLPEEIIEKACRLKMEVPERSLERIITIMEEMGMAPPGLLRRSTLHRVLQAKGLSRRKLKLPDRKDLARWQADYANDLWQSDMLEGPWLPDPQDPQRSRKTRLYLFLDDASRMVLYGRFFFKGDLPALELVFKRALQRYGLPRVVYYDNALVYRSGHMRLVCAELGIHRPIFTRPYRPQGHGKIEAWNRFCITNFLAELKASSIQTLEELNRAFIAWVEEEYNRRNHAELGCSPRERWLRDASRVRFAEEEKLRTVFLWREERRVDKCSMIHLFGEVYRVSPHLAGKKVQVRYDPEHLEKIEIWLQGKFRERVGIFRPQPHRPPQEKFPENPLPAPPEKTDYLGWLVRKHQTHLAGQEEAKDPGLEELLQIFRMRLSGEVFDEEALRQFWVRFSPLDLDVLTRRLDDLLAAHPNNLHISFYLETLEGGDPLCQ